MADLDLDAILAHFGIPDVPPTEELDTIDRLVAEVRRLRGLMRACLALNNARTGSDLIAAETAWRAALAPFLEADRG